MAEIKLPSTYSRQKLAVSFIIRILRETPGLIKGEILDAAFGVVIFQWEIAKPQENLEKRYSNKNERWNVS